MAVDRLLEKELWEFKEVGKDHACEILGPNLEGGPAEAWLCEI